MYKTTNMIMKNPIYLLSKNNATAVKYYVNRAIKGIPMEMTWQPLLALLLFGLLLIVAYPMFVKKIKSGGYEKI